jgi:hypothetical protein
MFLYTMAGEQLLAAGLSLVKALGDRIKVQELFYAAERTGGWFPAGAMVVPSQVPLIAMNKGGPGYGIPWYCGDGGEGQKPWQSKSGESQTTHECLDTCPGDGEPNGNVFLPQIASHPCGIDQPLC